MPNFKKIAKKIAKNRILYLFELADKIFPENKSLANRYVELAMKYAQRVKVRIPQKWKKRICHNCKKFLYPGINCRIRLQSRKGKGSHISVTCLECNHTTRYFIKTLET
jgi:ribonuclease P protein subunit RPR2